MGKVTELSCVICGAMYRESSALYVCPSCGDLATLRVSYDYDAARRALTREVLSDKVLVDQWRYLPLLPLEYTDELIPLRVGGTPLYAVPGLRKALGLEHLWVKDDTVNPSGSLKDRASAVTILVAREFGFREIATASTGNAAASLASLSAAVGMPCHIFVPKSAPVAKMAQLLVFGADVVPVQGSYDDAFRLCVEACQAFGWFNRNTGYNPYTVEGKKTVSMEIAEQLGWDTPDTIIVPVGDGCILSGVWKGFIDLKRIGLIGRLPRLVAAQAEGSQAIKQAFDGDGIIRPVKVNTLADSIAVSLPRNGVMAVQDLKDSRGLAVAVSDDETLEAMGLLGRTSGIFGEPAGVVALAALMKLCSAGAVRPEERVVILVTGSGLKDVNSALKGVSLPPALPCSLEAVKGRFKT
ncbi:MAG: threonine synthase [Candidatus Binatia bacterium]